MSKNITIPVPAVPFAPPVYTCHRAKKRVPSGRKYQQTILGGRTVYR